MSESKLILIRQFPNENDPINITACLISACQEPDPLLYKGQAAVHLDMGHGIKYLTLYKAILTLAVTSFYITK